MIIEGKINNVLLRCSSSDLQLMLQTIGRIPETDRLPELNSLYLRISHAADALKFANTNEFKLEVDE